MTTTLQTGKTKSVETSRERTRCRFWGFTPWIVIFLLLISNAATVLSERIHTAAYDLVAAIASTAGPVIADAVLAHSPTRAKAKAINLETRRLQTESVELIAKNRALKREHEVIAESRAALAKEHEALRAITVKRASAVKTLATRTTSVLAARSAEAVSTLPVRAAPYVGIAALVAFTTWELKTDCDLAKDLAALNAEHGNGNETIDTGKVCGAIESVPSPQQAWNGVKSHSSTALKATYDNVESVAKRLGLTLYTQPLK